MIIQGSNNPIVIQFDASVENIPMLVVSLWCDSFGSSSTNPVKTWDKESMLIDEDTAICQITEEETASLPASMVFIEAKGLDGDGNTIFWDSQSVDVKKRRDKVIRLTQVVVQDG